MMKVLLVAGAALLLIAAAPVLAPGTEADRDPGWLVKPDGAMVARFYPERAQRMEGEGRAALVCTVALDTRLHDCRVQSESPTGYGFGEAALKMADEMRMAPAIRNGVPVKALVRVPLAFVMPQPEPPPAPAILFGLAAGSLLFALLALGGLIAVYRAVGRGREP